MQGTTEAATNQAQSCPRYGCHLLGRVHTIQATLTLCSVLKSIKLTHSLLEPRLWSSLLQTVHGELVGFAVESL